MIKHFTIFAIGASLSACATTTSTNDMMASAGEPAAQSYGEEHAGAAPHHDGAAAENGMADTQHSEDIVADASEDATAELDPNEQVCRRVQRTGTRFRARVCQTRVAWQRMEEEAQQATETMQRGAEPHCGASGSC